MLVPRRERLIMFMPGAGTTRFRWQDYRHLVGDLLFLTTFALLAWG